MPYEWVEPELLVKHMGISVYHCYKDDCVMSYWYCTNMLDADSDGGEGAFDVREVLAQFTTEDMHKMQYAGDPRAERNHALICKIGIEAGYIT